KKASAAAMPTRRPAIIPPAHLGRAKVSAVAVRKYRPRVKPIFDTAETKLGFALAKRKSPGANTTQTQTGIDGKDRSLKPKISPPITLPMPCNQSFWPWESVTSGNHGYAWL